MTKQQYCAMLAWFQNRPAAKKALYGISRAAVLAVYVLYIGLLACLALRGEGILLLPTAMVPALAFAVGTALRACINRPRPYTKFGVEPLFPKNQPGCSMPSRHCFSAAAIAVAAWHVLPPLGLVLAALAVVIAVSRVLCGVHYISDVLAGLLFGTAFAGALLLGLFYPVRLL